MFGSAHTELVAFTLGGEISVISNVIYVLHQNIGLFMISFFFLNYTSIIDMENSYLAVLQ